MHLYASLLWSGERNGSMSVCSSNPLRTPHPQIDKLACQAQGVGVFAAGEITSAMHTVHTYFALLFYHTQKELSRVFWKRKRTLSFLMIDNAL
jgi:hypothetical protein